MAKAFKLGDYIKPEDVSELNTERIQYIDLDLIDPDPDNFYLLTGVDELAENISLVGLLDPLRVRPNGGRYIVESGHRRRAACLLLRDGGNHMFDKGVPCIVTYGEATDNMRRLRLIFANSHTRVLTPPELAKQAEEVTKLLCDLKAQGVELPGRMREHVAEALNVSASKLARVQAIRNNLAPELLAEYDAGRINESVAYTLSQQPVETQQQVCEQHKATGRKLDLMSASFVSNYVSLKGQLSERQCKINKGGLCINKDRILDKCFGSGSFSYAPCKYGTCCKDCSEWLNCRDLCPLLAEKAKEKKREKREARKDKIAAEKSKKETDIRTIEQVWARYAQALAVAGVSDEQFRRGLKRPEDGYNPFDMYMDKSKREALLDHSCTETKPNDPLPFRYSFHADDYSYLCRFADALGVSLDYLFLRSDQPETAEELLNNLPTAEAGTPRASAPAWQTGEPPEDGRYLFRLVPNEDGECQEYNGEYREGVWYFFEMPIFRHMKVKDWWPLPEKEAAE